MGIGMSTRCFPPENNFGITPENTSENNRTALLQATEGMSNDIVLGVGNHYIDNSLPINITGFAGSITMRPDSWFVFTNPTMGFRFYDPGDGMTLRNWQTHQPDLSLSNQPGNQNTTINGRLEQTSTVYIDSGYTEGSNSSGLIFHGNCKPRVKNLFVRNSGRDGLHFANNWDARVEGYAGINTGDDTLAFLNYENNENYYGGYAVKVWAENSYNARLITIVGQRNVTIENFRACKSYASGVYVVQEDAYFTREPSNVTIRNGYIEFAGTILKDGEQASHRDSIFYGSVGEGVSFENITSHAPDRNHIQKGVASGRGLDEDATVIMLEVV